MSGNLPWRKLRHHLILIATALTLAGCLSSGEEDTPDNEPPGNPGGDTEHTISGSVGDGPVVSADVSIRDAAGTLLGSVNSSSTADYDTSVMTSAGSYPLILETSGGTDLVTSTTPDFVMRSAVLRSADSSVANLNPFTTIAIETARDMSGGLTASNVEQAMIIVGRELNSGLSSLAGTAVMTAPVDAGNVAEMLRASEALGEVVRRTRDNLSSVGQNVDGDDVVAALGSDLVDGIIDGRGGPRADARIAALAAVALSQVMVETMQNRLRVQGSDAMIRLGNSLAQVFSGTPSPTLDELRATQGMIDSAAVGVLAAGTLQPSSEFDTLIADLATLSAGATPSQAESALSTDAATAFVGSLSAIASANDSQLDTLHDVLRSGTLPGGGNTPPVISGTPPTSIEAGTLYSFRPQASDADGDTLTFSISGLPTWASFDSATGEVSGTPSVADIGSNPGVTISVSDGEDTASLPAFTISVVDGATNTPPTISGTPTASVFVGDGYDFQPTASDADGDALTFTVSNLPAWASFDEQTGRLQGTPGSADTGNWTGIVISVSDGMDSASLPAFVIEVLPSAPGNNPPQISGNPQGSVDVGNAYSFQPDASDPDGDTLTFSIVGQPGWASFDTSSGRLSGTPGDADVGDWTGLVITVSDGQATASLPTFTITVNSVASNTPPEILGDPPTQVVAGSAYEFTPDASDADGDSLSFSVSGLPSWASFDTSNGRISGTPSDGDVGDWTGISITVSDGEDSATLGPFTISVQAVVLGSATLTWDPPTQNTDGTPLTDLAGYRIYWGTTPGQYTNSVQIDNPGVTTYVVENLAPGTYEFVSTAINSAGVESGLSNTATKTIN